MTRRERLMAILLVVVVVVVGGGLLAHIFIVEPLNQIDEQLLVTQEKLSTALAQQNQEEKIRAEIFSVNPRLSNWNKISLPPKNPALKKAGLSEKAQKENHRHNMQVEYERYLSNLMRTSGFRADTISVKVAQPDAKTKLDLPKNAEPPYERLAFKVTAKGNKETIAKMLTEFHKEPLLHQVRDIEISVPNNPLATSTSASTSDSGEEATPTGPRGGGAVGGGRRPARDSGNDGTLNLAMTVEALMVRDAEARATMKPEAVSYPPRVLSNRDFTMLAKRNMFTGIAPTYTPPTRTETPRQTENRAEVLRFVKLTMLYYDPNRDRWEGTLYDQANGPVRIDGQDLEGNPVKKIRWETTLNTRLRNELKIPDRYGNLLLDATVVHVDEQQLILKADKSFFRLRCGDTLYPAVEKPLSKAELKELGLEEEEEEAKAEEGAGNEEEDTEG